MRTMRILFSLLFAAMLFVSCGNDIFEDVKVDEDGSAKIFVGDVVVDQNDGTTFTKESVEVAYELNEDGTMTIFMKKVKFASLMPAINMEIPNVIIFGDESNMTLSGDNIVPIAMGGEFKKFTITELEGRVNKETFTMSFTCGGYPVTYSGEIEK